MRLDAFKSLIDKLYGIYPDTHIFFNLSDSIGMGYVKKAWSEGISVEAMPINIERIIMDEYSTTLVLDVSQPASELRNWYKNIIKDEGKTNSGDVPNKQ